MTAPSSRSGSESGRRSRSRRATAGIQLRGPQLAALQLSRLVIRLCFYLLPPVLAGAALWVGIAGLSDSGLEYVLAGVVAFFLPVGWGSIVLTLWGLRIQKALRNPAVDTALCIVGGGTVTFLGLFAFGESGTPLWQVFLFGLTMGLALTVRSSEDSSSLVVRFFTSAANRQTILVLGGTITGLGLVSIINVIRK